MEHLKVGPMVGLREAAMGAGGLAPAGRLAVLGAAKGLARVDRRLAVGDPGVSQDRANGGRALVGLAQGGQVVRGDQAVQADRAAAVADPRVVEVWALDADLRQGVLLGLADRGRVDRVAGEGRALVGVRAAEAQVAKVREEVVAVDAVREAGVRVVREDHEGKDRDEQSVASQLLCRPRHAVLG